MTVRIRLQRRGAKKRPYYAIVVADSSAPRGGRFIERVGSYDPCKEPPLIQVQRQKYDEWVRKGAQPSDTVSRIVRSSTTRDQSGEGISGD
jgi:small subunit ribosomal protein S16